VAVSIVLLVGAGLFLRTLNNLRHVDVGFDPQNLLLFRINPALNRYDEAKTARLYQELMERLNAVPGVKGAAMSQPSLLSGSVSSTSVFVHGRSYPQKDSRGSSSGAPLIPGRQDDDNSINQVQISPNFFDVMGIPIVLGRALSATDTKTSQKVVVINETAAKRYFPGASPIGQHFGSSPETTNELEIVGVLRDVKYNSVREEAPPTMYLPYLQTRMNSTMFEVRTAAAPSSVAPSAREVVRQIDSALPVTDVSTQIEQVERRFAQEKLFAQAYAMFGALALVLAAIGLFGLMSYNVSRRTNEIGIRMALGAQRGTVLGMVMRESMVLVAIGAILGAVVALAAGRSIATLLYGLPPTDVPTLLAAIAIMSLVGGLAGYLPARRASRVDPMVALHYE